MQGHMCQLCSGTSAPVVAPHPFIGAPTPGGVGATGGGSRHAQGLKLAFTRKTTTATNRRTINPCHNAGCHLIGQELRLFQG